MSGDLFSGTSLTGITPSKRRLSMLAIMIHKRNSIAESRGDQPIIGKGMRSLIGDG